jgi:membrane-bound lytic murein transglycosylase D
VYPRPKGSKRAIRTAKKQLIHKYTKILPKAERKNVALQNGARGLYERGLLNFGMYYPSIVEELEKNNMPPQIALLPFVESAYNSKATSPVGAVGMWQIMPKTGRLYGVKNRKHLRNHEVAMKTAIKILKANKEMLGDWILAINAYHSGPGRIMQASDIANSKDICEILNFMDENDVKIKGYKFYSRNYVAQLFAIEKAVFGDLEEEGVEDEDESDYVDAGL